MTILKFIFIVILGIVLEYFVKLVFPGRVIFIVPQILIFLGVIYGPKNIFDHFFISALLYDFWTSQSIGTVTGALLVVFLLLSALEQILYLDGRKTRIGKMGLSVTSSVIFSTILFLIYCILVHYFDIWFLSFHQGYPAWSWQFMSWSTVFLSFVWGLVVFWILFFIRLTRLAYFRSANGQDHRPSLPGLNQFLR